MGLCMQESKVATGLPVALVSAVSLLRELLGEFGKDGHGGEFEDGEHPLIDRVRAFLADNTIPFAGISAEDRAELVGGAGLLLGHGYFGASAAIQRVLAIPQMAFASNGGLTLGPMLEALNAAIGSNEWQGDHLAVDLTQPACSAIERLAATARAAGIEQVLAMLKKEAAAYEADHISTEGDTNSPTGGAKALEHWNFLLEQIEEVQALKGVVPEPVAEVSKAAPPLGLEVFPSIEDMTAAYEESFLQDPNRCYQNLYVLAMALRLRNTKQVALATCYAIEGLKVEFCGNGKWAVRDGFSVLSRAGEWVSEPQPSSRTDDWIADHRFISPQEAIYAAEAANARKGGQK